MTLDEARHNDVVVIDGVEKKDLTVNGDDEKDMVLD